MTRRDERTCDGCGETIPESPRMVLRHTEDSMALNYEMNRSDQYGYVDTLDACSPECLSKLAVAHAHALGSAKEAAAVRMKLAGAPPKVRKWWQR